MRVSNLPPYLHKLKNHSCPLTGRGTHFLHHIAQLVALSALWGASFLFIRIAVPQCGPQGLAATRIALATLTLALVMRALRQAWPRTHMRLLFTISWASVALPFVLYAWAAQHLPAGYSALINALALPFGVVFCALYGEERFSRRKLLGCALGFAGVASVVRLGPIELTPSVWLAVLACVGASACYGFSTPHMKRATRSMEPLQISAAIHAMSLVLLMPGALYTHERFAPQLSGWAAVGVMGVVTSGLAYWLSVRIMREVSPIAAMSPSLMIPIFGVVWGWLFLNEPISGGLWLGIVLVAAATWLVTDSTDLTAKKD
jgi:drug/metabolite transporter (DMT)-like permease